MAQATGSLTGVVTDATGAALPGVRVEAINKTTAQVRTTPTGTDGFYRVPLLSPAVYQVKVTLPGFTTSVCDACEVVVNETLRVDFVLNVGSVLQEITVSEAPSLVETTNATLGIVVEERRIVDLPLNGRNFTQLGTLIPGVVAPPAALGGQSGNATAGGGIGNATGGFNVNGMRNQSNNFLLDGAPNNDTFNSGFVLRPPPDAIQEFKILTHSFEAEFGHSSGSVVNVVTRSGTNQWHGTLWEFNRNEALQARNFFATSKPRLRQDQFGGATGGPLIPDRLFMFGYLEGFLNTEGQTDTKPVLSAAQRSGDFSGDAAIRDPLTGAAFLDNVIPVRRIHPVAARLLQMYVPLPNSPGNRVVRSPDTTDKRWQFGNRFDFKVNDVHDMLGRYIRGHSRNVNPLGGSSFAPSSNVASATLDDLTVADTWVLGNDRINAVRVSLNRIDADPTRSSGLDAKDFGFGYSGSNNQSAGLPFVNIPGFFTLGDSQQQFGSRTNSVLAIADNFTWQSGSHAAKFGGEFRREQIKASYIFDPNGDYTFNGQYSGNAATDFLLGFPAVFRQGTGDANLKASSWTIGVYGQDQLRLGPRATLNYGLRYEISRPFEETRDRLHAFHPGQQSTVFPEAPRGLVYPGDAGVPRGTYATDTNNVAPRVALVWTTRGEGQMSVRAGWGIFYDTVPAQGDFFQSGVVAPPFQSLTEVTFPLQLTSSPFANPLQGSTGTNGFPPGLIFVGWGPTFKTPLAQHWNVSVQRQLADLGIEIGYAGSRARNLPIYMEINPTSPIVSPVPVVGPRLYPAFSLLRPTLAVARSWYDSLQISTRLRSWRGIGILGAYTFSHAMDHISALNVGGESRPMLPVTIGDQLSIDAALRREKGDALFDVRHRFVVSGTYELPRLENRSALTRSVLGRWQVAGIVQGQTAFPFTVIEPNNVSLTSLTNRPNMICDPNTGGARTVAQWFNTNCFQRLTLPANAGQVGNEARNSVRGPGFRRVDVALMKSVEVHREHRIQVRVEAFDLFNSIRFNQPGNQIGSPTFGQITGAEDGRIVQLGLKYIF